MRWFWKLLHKQVYFTGQIFYPFARIHLHNLHLFSKAIFEQLKLAFSHSIHFHLLNIFEVPQRSVKMKNHISFMPEIGSWHINRTLSKPVHWFAEQFDVKYKITKLTKRFLKSKGNRQKSLCIWYIVQNSKQ